MADIWIRHILSWILIFSYITHTHIHRTVLQPSWILSGTTQLRRHQKGKTNLDLLQQEIVSGNGISWAICKSAPWPRHTTTPASLHSLFYRPDALPAAQPTASIQWRTNQRTEETCLMIIIMKWWQLQNEQESCAIAKMTAQCTDKK